MTHLVRVDGYTAPAMTEEVCRRARSGCWRSNGEQAPLRLTMRRSTRNSRFIARQGNPMLTFSYLPPVPSAPKSSSSPGVKTRGHISGRLLALSSFLTR